MRKLKKVAAVLLSAAMTMSASVMAFADQNVTLHFQNGSNWDKGGAWVYQGIAWDVNVCPEDKCAVKTQEETGVKKVWPGALMDDDKATGWKTLTFTVTDSYVTDGIIFKFNNYVADSATNDTTTDADLESIKASGIAMNGVNGAVKEETGNVTINKKLINNTYGGSLSDIYVTWDGKTATATPDAPEAYTSNVKADAPAAGSGSSSNAGSSTTTDTNAGSASNAGSTTGTANTTKPGTTSGTKAPVTGDSVAVTVVMFGLVAAVAFVASKKKVNA